MTKRSVTWEERYSSHDAAVKCDALVRAWTGAGRRIFVLRANEVPSDVRELFTSLFPHLGTPARYAEDVRVGDRENQRSGGIWMEVRFDPRFPDAYRHSANAQPLHTDGSYIPGFPNASMLCCVANAACGGETTFLDGDDLVECLTVEAPTLLDSLESIPVAHARSGDRREGHILRRQGAQVRLYWNYHCVAQDASSAARRLADEFHWYLANSAMVKERTLAVKLGAGDAVLWKDDELLHGRNAFSATEPSERFLWKCVIDVGNFK